MEDDSRCKMDHTPHILFTSFEGLKVYRYNVVRCNTDDVGPPFFFSFEGRVSLRIVVKSAYDGELNYLICDFFYYYCFFTI